MKLTNGDILQAREPILKLLEQKFPVMVSYKLAKLSAKLNDQLKVIDDVRNGLIKKYGEKNEQGNLEIKPQTEAWVKFVEEFNELMGQEQEYAIEKVKLPEKIASTCDKCNHNMDKPLEIDAKTLMQLDKMIEV